MPKPQTYVLNANHPGRGQVLANLHAFVDRLPEDKAWRVEISRAHGSRSTKQNKAMWGVAYDTIMEATGLQGEEERKQMHKDFCGDFFGWTKNALGQRRPVRTTTTNERGEKEPINTETMAAFYDFIQRKAAEYGIDVPNPDPLWFRKAA